MKIVAFSILLAASSTFAYRLFDIQNDGVIEDGSTVGLKEEVVKVQADELKEDLFELPTEDLKQVTIETQRVLTDLEDNEAFLRAELAYTKEKLNELSKPKRKKVAYVKLEPVKDQKEESNGFWDWIFQISKKLIVGAAYFLFGLKIWKEKSEITSKHESFDL